jgi:ABC-type bacteriocin/lantibiotic exporter with double-glycine peptidase domain
MPAPEIIEPVIQKEDGDCALAAVAMLIQKPYRLVSEAALKMFRKRPHETGLELRQMRALMRKFGVESQSLSPTDLDLSEETGILSISKKNPHVVLLFQGVIVDPANGLLYDIDAYCADQKAKITRLIKIL